MVTTDWFLGRLQLTNHARKLEEISVSWVHVVVIGWGQLADSFNFFHLKWIKFKWYLTEVFSLSPVAPDYWSGTTLSQPTACTSRTIWHTSSTWSSSTYYRSARLTPCLGSSVWCPCPSPQPFAYSEMQSHSLQSRQLVCSTVGCRWQRSCWRSYPGSSAKYRDLLRSFHSVQRFWYLL